jgi:hypothetical protein
MVKDIRLKTYRRFLPGVAKLGQIAQRNQLGKAVWIIGQENTAVVR